MTEHTKSQISLRACRTLAGLIARHTCERGDGAHSTAIPQVELLRESATSTATCSVYSPSLGIVVQGKKEVLLSEETYECGAAQYLVVSVDLPVNGFVVEAAPETPYLAFKLDLEPSLLYDIVLHTQNTRPHTPMDKNASPARAMFVRDADLKLLDCAIRLTRLLDTPEDIPFLAPLIIREIYYRLLVGEQGATVRQIATPGSNMQRISQVIRVIKTDFAQPMRVDELAARAHMSISSFHRHFKEVTSMSPLQYQKQLRLLEARRLMLAEHANADSAAYRVGYESPSQFSREYSRMFGAPPITDIARLRTI